MFILVHVRGKLEKDKFSAIGNWVNKLWCVYSTESYPIIQYYVTEDCAMTCKNICSKDRGLQKQYYSKDPVHKLNKIIYIMCVYIYVEEKDLKSIP